MKIQKVRFMGWRNVPDMEKELKGANILLIAENKKGKSNFIKGLLGALAGTVGPDAIAHGKEKSEVEILMTNFNESGEPVPGTDYTFKMVVKKDKAGEQKVSLEVMAPNGFKETKKSIIGTICGETELEDNFVELSKSEKGKKRQLEIVKSYLDDETKKQLALWENKAKQAYDERTEINRDIKTLQGFIKSSGLNPDDFTRYAKPVDSAGLLKQRDDISKHNLKFDQVQERIHERSRQMISMKEEIADLKSKIEEKEASLKEYTEKNTQAQGFLQINPKSDTSALDKQIKEAEAHNLMAQKVADMLASQKKLKEAEFNSGELTALCDSCKQTIADTLRQMDFPIDGITFDENNVYYHGKMIDESTLSTSEIMMLEVELKMSRMPSTEVVFIERGESLGIEMCVQLQKKARERGYQLIMEQVERGTEELKIELMPDYSNVKNKLTAKN